MHVQTVFRSRRTEAGRPRRARERVSQRLTCSVNPDDGRMGREKLRRQGRSLDLVRKPITLEVALMNEVYKASADQNMSIGLYLTTLLNGARTQDGSLPDLTFELERAIAARRQEQAKTAA